MDMRLQVYGLMPAVAIVAAGPVDEVNNGTELFARLYILHTGAVVADLNCGTTRYAPIDQHSSRHAAATVLCKLSADQWDAISALSDELGVCLVRNAIDAFCDVAAIVPVGVPPRYPKFPMAWADRYVDSYNVSAPRTRAEIQDENDYASGKGRIAMCVPGVRGDLYARSVDFFLRYYRKMGVDTVKMYMHSPGSTFARIVESIASEQQFGARAKNSVKNYPRLVILPWCVQLGASYGCTRGQPVARQPGGFEFVGTNHGQLLAHQDCLYRSIGTFRWVLFVDLDEYVVPMRPGLLSLGDLINQSAKMHQGVAAAELLLRSAFFEFCSPTSSGNASVPLAPEISPSRLSALPMTALSAARVSLIYPNGLRTKYMCNPHACDRVGVHADYLKLCDRTEHLGALPRWPTSCKTYVVSEKDAFINHIRADGRPPQAREHILYAQSRPKTGLHTPLQCHLVPGVIDQDWSMTNFVVKVLDIV